MSSEMEQLLNEQENAYVEIYKGTVVDGEVIIEKDDCYYVDLQYKTDGMLPKSEVFDDEKISRGDKVRVYVSKIDKNTGEIILSKKRVDEIQAWDDIEKDKILQVKAVDNNSKGLIVSYKGSIRGFVPLSHIELRYINEEAAKSYIGQEFEAQVLDVDPKKRRLILSRKAILQKIQDEKKAEIIGDIEEGKVFKGIVRDIKDYGMFVDIGGITGLVHVSEITWDRSAKVKDMFKVDQEVEVQVISFDKDTERLSLSVKSLQKHPWEEYIEGHKEGDIVKGEVKNIKEYGAFINLYPMVDGFVHISNLSNEYVKKPSDILQLGEEIDVRIINIDPENKKIELSLILEEPEEKEEQEEAEVQAAETEEN